MNNKISKWILELRVAVVSTLCNYMIFSKSACFISVLISANIVLWQTVILISYILDTWDNVGLFNAILIVNIQDGLTGIMILLLSYISHSFSGPFAMVVLSSFASFICLLLLWEDTNNFSIFYVVVVLLAMGKAGLQPLLKAFFADQFRTSDERFNQDEKRVEACTNFWWGFWYFIGSLVAIFGVGSVSDWTKKLEITKIVMVVAIAVFLLGSTLYHHERPTGSSLATIYWVLKAAISKRGLLYPDDPNDYYMNDSNDVQLLPQTRFLRWLDKAAVIKTAASSLGVEEQEMKGELCTVTQVKEVKLLLRTIPIWATFFVYCLVSATGNTVFFEQTTNLNDHIASGLRLPSAFFTLVQSFSSYLSTYIHGLIARRWPSVRNTRVQICLGMLSSYFCCITARFVEVQRLNLVTLEGFEDDTDSIISMSILWLIPQFCLLGITDELVKKGLAKFFYEQVGESMKRYGPEFSEFVLGIGKFVSIFWLLTFKSWIGYTINKSRLDNYYSILAIAVIGSLYLFSQVSRMYDFNRVQEEHEEANPITMAANV